MKARITGLQFVSLMFFAVGILTLTRPSADGISFVGELISSLAAVFIEAILFVPALIYVKKFKSADPLEGIFRFPFLARMIFAVYFLYFTLSAISALGAFSYFLITNFPELSKGAAVVFLMSAVSLYAACQGIEALSRSAFVVGVIFLALVFLVTISVRGDYDPINLAPFYPKSASSFAKIAAQTLQKLSRSVEIVVFPFLICRSENKRSSKKGAVSLAVYFLLLKFVFTVIVLTAVRAVLGDYSKSIFDPFYSLSTYARVSVIERFDAVYGFVWTLGAFIKLALLFYLGSLCLKNALPTVKRSAAAALCALLCFLPSLFIVGESLYESPLMWAPKLWLTVILGTAIPLVSLIITIYCNKKEKNA